MFEPVFGHNRIKSILQRMIQNDVLHHGLLFYGPHGIGKRLMARQTARALLCETRTSCGQCKHCRKLDSGNHPDYKEIGPDGRDIKVDQVREISENLHFRPFEARARFIVIDGAELFREEAANAFLKSLEEPPDYVYFILIASDLKALLATIRSRCQKIAFQSLNQDDKAAILQQKFEKDKIQARKLAAISFRRLETEDTALNAFQEDVRQVLAFYNLMLDEGHALDFFQDQLRDKDKGNIQRFTDHLVAVTRELTLRANGFAPQMIFEPFADDMLRTAQRVDAPAWRQAWADITDMLGKRRLNLNQTLWFNTLSVTGLNLRESAERKLKQRLTPR